MWLPSVIDMSCHRLAVQVNNHPSCFLSELFVRLANQTNLISAPACLWQEERATAKLAVSYR